MGPLQAILYVQCIPGFYWVAVKELNLSYYIGGTILITIYTHYGNIPGF